MALGLKGGGDYLPIIKYNAKAGRWYRREGSGATAEEIDVTDIFQAVFDFHTMQHGWCDLDQSPPSIIMVPFEDPMPTQPSAKHKNAVKLRARLSKECGGGDHELLVVSAMLSRPVDEIHDAFLSNGATELPAVRHLGVEAVKGQKGTNYRPKLDVAAWVGADFFDGEAATPEPAQQEAPPPAATTAPAASGAEAF